MTPGDDFRCAAQNTAELVSWKAVGCALPYARGRLYGEFGAKTRLQQEINNPLYEAALRICRLRRVRTL